MAIVEILENLGDGKYMAQVMCHREWVGPLMEAAQQRVVFYNEAMAGLEEKILTTADETAAASRELDKLIRECAGQPASNAQRRAVLEAQMQVQRCRNTEAAIRAQYARAEMCLLANQQHIRDLQELKNRVDNDIRELWCVDLSENLTGSLPAMEINGEPEHMVLGAQSLEIASAPSAARPHGRLKPISTMTAAQAVFSWAIMPGWQKWKPTYRTATISSINIAANTASLTLDESRSYIKNLEINQADTLADVPVDYMDCHAAAFEEGDHVVVMFSDQEFRHPRIIGFVERPKGCGFVWSLVHSHKQKEGLYPQWPEALHAVGIFCFSSNMQKIIGRRTHSKLAVMKSIPGPRSGRVYDVYPEYAAHTPLRSFFVVKDPESFFEFRHPHTMGILAGYARQLICGTDPEWIFIHTEYAPTGTFDADGHEIYEQVGPRLAEITAGAEFLFVRAIWPGKNTMEVRRYTMDGLFIGVSTFDVLSPQYYYEDRWWIEHHAGVTWLGMNNDVVGWNVVHRVPQDGGADTAVELQMGGGWRGNMPRAVTYNGDFIFYGYQEPREEAPYLYATADIDGALRHISEISHESDYIWSMTSTKKELFASTRQGSVCRIAIGAGGALSKPTKNDVNALLIPELGGAITTMQDMTAFPRP
ncbi:hypothetical protein [Desulfobotulus sp.]|uniref:hypothetical protein n=1 Tax=Desulfobotulus sp. TaxID=1940337 RepID=UPI002A3669A4|nr:hypothetical protein [Desulfobotulus sp.]MDY0164512.1 hypothetical protein [Desulfobotulus sp.]